MIAAALLAAAVYAAPPPPVVYQAATRDYDVRLRIAPELKAVPTAYAALQAKTVADLKTFEASAVADMARNRRQMPTSIIANTPEVARVEVDFVTRTPHLIGFIRRDYVDGHGAHPGSDMSAMLFDLQSGRRLAATDLLRPGADMAPLNAALVAAIKTAKAKRDAPLNLTDGFVKLAQLTWSGALDLTASHDLLIALASGPAANRKSDQPVLATIIASTLAARAGGMQFLYSPYDIGPYVEGAYRIVLPLRVFAGTLKPEYRSDFAGVPAGDLSPDPLADFPADVPPAGN